MAKEAREAREIGKAIKRIIVNRGLRQVDIAEKLGCSKQALSYMVNHKEDRFWSLSEINDVSNVLRINPESLMKYIMNTDR